MPGILTKIIRLLFLGIFLSNLACNNVKNNTFFTSSKYSVNDSILSNISEEIYFNNYYNDLDKMLQIVDSVKSEYPEHPIFEALKYKIFGHHHFVQGHYEESEKYFDNALDIARIYKKQFPLFYETVLNNVSEISQKLYKYDEATSYIFEMIYFAEQIKDTNQFKKASRIYQLANILYNKGDYIGSIDFLRESFRILQTYKPNTNDELYETLFLKFHIKKLQASALFNIWLYDKALNTINYAYQLEDSILQIDKESIEFTKAVSAELKYLHSYILLKKKAIPTGR